jgi:hypothetical protein
MKYFCMMDVVASEPEAPINAIKIARAMLRVNLTRVRFIYALNLAP